MIQTEPACCRAQRWQFPAPGVTAGGPPMALARYGVAARQVDGA